MSAIATVIATPQSLRTSLKFRHPDITAKGERRAFVHLKSLDTLWFNTGTLCNIECVNCYIESSPSNDRLVYISAAEVAPYLDEIAERRLGTEEIGFTGGEPFMNPEMNTILELTLSRSFNALVLTNAMQPMLRKRIRSELLAIKNRYGDKLTLRVSLDHYIRERHEEERGSKTWDKALEGLVWLSDNDFNIHVAGRTCWDEGVNQLRAGYARLFADHDIRIDAYNPVTLVLFPEMDENADVPEITVDCWNILGKNPDEVMCASSRMVVKRRGDRRPVVLPCTLLPYDPQFEMGETLAEAAGVVKLNHPYCSKFCVLGGASCSVSGG